MVFCLEGVSLKKTFFAPILLIVLQGCAFNDYEGAAKRSAMANLCEQEGFISNKEFAYYTSFQLREYPHQNMQQVDDNKLQQMYQDEVEKFKRYNIRSAQSQATLRTECAHISVVAERVRPNNQIQAREPSASSQINQMGDSVRQGGNQALQQSISFPPPAVAPMSTNPLGGGKVSNCWVVSGIEYCK